MALSVKINVDADTAPIKAKIENMTRDLSQSISKLGKDIHLIDDASLDQQFKSMANQFAILEKSSARLQENMALSAPKLDMSLAEADLKKFLELQKEIENFDMSKGDEELSKLTKKFQELTSSMDLNNTVAQAAEEFDRLNRTFAQQQKALGILESSGKKGTEEYKKLKEEAKATGERVKELNKVFEDTKKATGFMERLAQFGLVSQGIQNLTGAFSQMAVPYVELDKATQSMRTLGDEAAEMAPRLREAAISMSKDLPFGAGQIQSAMADALASGVQGGEEGLKKFAETAAKLATGGGADLSSVVQGLGATLNAFGETSEETARYSDYMFNIVNAGVTTIDQLNGSLANVTPTAASMGVSFDKVGGALALMTQKGVSTNQSVTKLNALLIEMAKPSVGLSKALKAAGMSAEDFQKQISSDFVGSLKTLQTGFEKTGQSATQSFSSSNAGAAFNLLMGDVNMLQESLDFVANTTGSTENAFNEMGDSVEVQSQKMKAAMDAFIIGTIDNLGSAGSSLVVFSQTLSDLSPQITAMAGIGSMIPSGFTKKVGELASTLGGKLLTGLKSATMGSNLLNVSLLANPVFLITTGVVALTAALYLFYKANEETAEKQLEQVEAEKELLKSRMDMNKKNQDVVKSKMDAVKAFEQEGQAAMKNQKLMVQLAESYPGVIDSTKSYEENLKALKIASQSSAEELSKLKDEMAEMGAKTLELDFQAQKLNTDIAKGQLYEAASDASGMAAMMVENYSKEIYKATNSEELNKAAIEFRTALMNEKGGFKGLTPSEKKSIDEKIQAFVKEQGKVIDLRKKDVERDMSQLTKVMGMSEDDAIDSLAKKYNVSTEEIKKMVEQQKLSVAETEKQKEGASELAAAWDEATKSNAQAISENVAAINELQKRLKENPKDKTLQQQLKEEKAELVAQTKEYVKQKKETDQINENTQIMLGLKERQAKAAKDELADVKKIYDLRVKAIQNELTDYELKSEIARLQSGREKSITDEITLQDKKNKAIEKQREELIKTYKATLDNDGTIINIGVRLNKDQKKEEVLTELNSMMTEINQKAMQGKIANLELDAKIKTTKTDLEQQMHDLELEQLKFDIELGIKNKQDLVDFLALDLNKLQNEITEKQGEIQALQDSLLAVADGRDDDRKMVELQIAELTKQLNELKMKELSSTREIEQDKKAIREAALKDMQERHEKEIAEIEKHTNLINTISEASINAVNEGMNNKLDSDKNKRLQALEEQKKAEVITEDIYNKQKVDIENEYQNKIKALQEAARTAELEAERQQTLAILEEKKKRLEEQLSLLDENKDADAVAEIRNQLSALQDEISEKGDYIKFYSVELQSSLAEVFANLLGDDTAMKDSAKKMFAGVGGILKKAASATATKLILDELMKSSLGVGALFAVPFITSIINAAISKIIDPIITSITSFSTGGRVDNPTLAVVGDASQSRAGSNTEWIFRDDQLALVIDMTLSKYIGAIEKAMMPIIRDLDILNNQDLSKLAVNDNGELINTIDDSAFLIYNKLQQLNDIMIDIPNKFKNDIKPSNVVNIGAVYNEIVDLDALYKKGLMSKDDYLDNFNEKRLKIRSYAGGGFVQSPQLAIVGDAGKNNPELILNNPQLEGMIAKVSNATSEQLRNELSGMRELLERLVNKTSDVYIDRAKITDEIQREMNIRRFA